MTPDPLTSEPVGRCLVCRAVLELARVVRAGHGLSFRVVETVTCDCGTRDVG